MSQNDAFAAAVHLHVVLRRKTGRVTDTEWLVSNADYARAIVHFAREKARSEGLAELLPGRAAGVSGRAADRGSAAQRDQNALFNHRRQRSHHPHDRHQLALHRSPSLSAERPSVRVRSSSLHDPACRLLDEVLRNA